MRSILSADRGVDAISFYFTGLFAMCTDFTMFRFSWYIFLLNLVRYILISHMQRIHTTAGSFLTV